MNPLSKPIIFPKVQELEMKILLTILGNDLRTIRRRAGPAGFHELVLHRELRDFPDIRTPLAHEQLVAIIDLLKIVHDML